jgi:hypothetical protein
LAKSISISLLPEENIFDLMGQENIKRRQSHLARMDDIPSA